MYWFPSIFSDSVYILHFLRSSLSLLAMQSQAFISPPNATSFLLTAPSATPSCLCQAQSCQDRFLESDLPNVGRAKQPSPFFTSSTYFHSGNPSTLISTLLIHFLLSLPSELLIGHSPKSPQTCTQKCNSAKLLFKSLYPPSHCPLTHSCRAPTKTQWISRWDPTAFWADRAYSVHLHTLGRVHLLFGGSAAFQRCQDKHSSALKGSCKAPRRWTT